MDVSDVIVTPILATCHEFGNLQWSGTVAVAAINGLEVHTRFCAESSPHAHARDNTNQSRSAFDHSPK